MAGAGFQINGRDMIDAQRQPALTRTATVLLAAWAAAAAVAGLAQPPASGPGPKLRETNVCRLTARIEGPSLRIDVAGRLFTAYCFDAKQKYPYFWPVNGPATGRSITTESSEPYPHHHSLFFACDRVNGANFWQQGNDRGRIASQGPRITHASGRKIEFEDRCLWCVPGKEPIIEDRRRVIVSAPSKQLQFIDFEIVLRALEDVRFEKTNHSLFSARVVPALGVTGGGRLIDAAGRRGEEQTFGQKAAWCDYSGDNGGAVEGIAILGHPENPWFPAPWFTRDYGFISPTPMFWLDKKGWRLAKGETLRLRYRVVAHSGNEQDADVAGIYRRWAGAESIDVVPVARAFAGTPVNAGQALISDARRQYIAFYDAHRQLTVGVRELNSADWQFARLDERVGWDAHNRIAMALDRRGHIHLTANHHCSDLNYFRTARPGDITSFERIDRFGPTRETRVTYPHFLHFPQDGRLAVMYRFGASGQGERLLLRYDETEQVWRQRTRGSVISGKPRFSAYPMGITFDSKGRLHLAWCWRETPDVETNERVCYALSPDGGTSWQRSDGRPLQSPIRPEQAEVVDPVGHNGGLLNGGTIAIDAQDRPYIGYLKYGPNGGTQMYVATRQSDGWRIIQISNWDYRWELLGRGSIPSAGISLPQLAFRPNGGLDIFFAHREYYWAPQVIRTTTSRLKETQPGQFASQDHISPLRRIGIDHSYVVCNQGPLPQGERHHMIQQTADANRDREPAQKMPPTMIHLGCLRSQ